MTPGIFEDGCFDRKAHVSAFVVLTGSDSSSGAGAPMVPDSVGRAYAELIGGLQKRACRPGLPRRSISARAWMSTGQGLPGPRLPDGAAATDFTAGR
jgi:hypothetical protein